MRSSPRSLPCTRTRPRLCYTPSPASSLWALRRFVFQWECNCCQSILFFLWLLHFWFWLQILSAYFVVLPLRDEGAISFGLSNLPGLFVGSLVLTLIAAPVSTLIFSLPNLSKNKVWSHLRRFLMPAVIEWIEFSQLIFFFDQSWAFNFLKVATSIMKLSKWKMTLYHHRLKFQSIQILNLNFQSIVYGRWIT